MFIRNKKISVLFVLIFVLYARISYAQSPMDTLNFSDSFVQKIKSTSGSFLGNKEIIQVQKIQTNNQASAVVSSFDFGIKSFIKKTYCSTVSFIGFSCIESDNIQTQNTPPQNFIERTFDNLIQNQGNSFPYEQNNANDSTPSFPIKETVVRVIEKVTSPTVPSNIVGISYAYLENRLQELKTEIIGEVTQKISKVSPRSDNGFNKQIDRIYDDMSENIQDAINDIDTLTQDQITNLSNLTFLKNSGISTFEGLVNITQEFVLDGYAGQAGQVLISNGTSSTPVWTTLTISGSDAGTLDSLDSIDFLQAAQNLSDITSTSTARTNLGLGTLSTLSDLASFTTDDLNEGTNQYFTDTKVINAITNQNISLFTNDSGYLTSVSGLNISDLTNDANFISDLSSFTTDDLTEGTTNHFSQWGNSGSDVYFNTGNVGIGTTTPGAKLTLGSGQFELPIGSVASPSMYFSNQSNTGIYSSAAGFIDFSAYSSRRMSIGGAISAYVPISIQSTSGTASAADIRMVENGNGIFRPSTNALAITTNSTERMRVDSAGNIGIGTTTPTEKLDITGNIKLTDTLKSFGTVNTSNYSEIFSTTDTTNGTIDALYIVPPVNQSRIFFGKSGKTAYSLNFANVSNFENVPANLGLVGTTVDGLSASKISSGGTYLMLEAPGNSGNGFISSRDSAALSRNSLAFIFHANDSDTYKRSSGFVFAGKENSTNWTSPHTVWTNDGESTRLMTLNNNGNLGIGTSTPAYNLQVTAASGDTQISAIDTIGSKAYFRTNANNGAVRTTFGSDTGAGFFWVETNHPFKIATNSAERLRISSAGGFSFGSSYVATNPGLNNAIFEGSVGIGTNAPTQTLHVLNAVSGATLQGRFANSSSAQPAGFHMSNGGWDITFRTIPSVAWFDIGDSGGASQHQWSAKNYYLDATGRIGFSGGTLSNSVGPNHDVYLDRSAAGTMRTNGSHTITGTMTAVNSISTTASFATKGLFGTTTTATGATLQVHSTPADIGSYSLTNWNSTGNAVSAFIKTPTSNGGSSLSESEPALILGREGLANQSYANFAEFKLRRWENNGVNPRTALDIALTHTNASTGDTIMSLLSSGNVGIGTTTPSEKLSVVGNGQFTAVGSGAYAFDLNLTSDGTFTTSASDERLKENITSLVSASILEKIALLRPVTFDWKTNGSHDIGLIAQEVEKIFPELVFTNPTDGYKGVNYSRFTALLISSVQEISNKLNNILVWFKDDKFNIQGDICVDDVCVTKEEFKRILQQGSPSISSNEENNNPSGDEQTDVTQEPILPDVVETLPDVPVVEPTVEPVVGPVGEVVPTPIEEETPPPAPIISEETNPNEQGSDTETNTSPSQETEPSSDNSVSSEEPSSI